jgi:hypothetical protein
MVLLFIIIYLPSSFAYWLCSLALAGMATVSALAGCWLLAGNKRN